MAYYNETDDIKCPYCEEVFNTDNFYPEQDEITEIYCDNCNKTYTITTSYSKSFTTQCGDEKTNDCTYVPQLIYNEIKRNTIGDKPCVYAVCLKCEETAYVEESKVNTKGRIANMVKAGR